MAVGRMYPDGPLTHINTGKHIMNQKDIKTNSHCEESNDAAIQKKPNNKPPRHPELVSGSHNPPQPQCIEWLKSLKAKYAVELDILYSTTGKQFLEEGNICSYDSDELQTKHKVIQGKIDVIEETLQWATGNGEQETEHAENEATN